MLRLCLILVLLFPLVSAQAADLKVGDPAPDFQTINEQGKTVSLKDFRGKSVVLYFYPKDDTPGCTLEAQSFRDHHAEFARLDTVILGLSGDSQASHKSFKEKHALPFSLLVDKDHQIAKSYGVKIGFFPSRDVIMIDGQGKVARILRSVNPQTVVATLLRGAQ